MNRVGVFVVILVVSLASFALVTAWYLGSYQGSGSSFGGMMGQMMGGGSSGMTLGMPAGVWTLLVVLLAVAVLGAAGVGYYVAFPEIRAGKAQPSEARQEGNSNPEASWEALMRTSKPEEKKVLETLAAHDGSYLQKFVVKETGLSRLKTHRIVSRLAERGVVTVERSGNTNQVSLAPWVRAGASLPPPDRVSS